MTHSLAGKRILVTQAQAFMGPPICEVLAEQGADVVANSQPLAEQEAAASVVAAAGHFDILVANLALAAPSTPALDVTEAEWRETFAALVDPLPRLVRAAVPAMLARGRGKVVVIGSAAALRGMRRASTYSAARGAQLAYVQAVGVELAPHNVQINAIAQNYVENPTYFPPALTADPVKLQRMLKHIPAGRLARSEESARLAVYLASEDADFFVGQVIPFSGGWVTP